MVLIAVRPNHPLHREPSVHMVVLVADVDRLQRVKQRAALVPIHVFGTVNHVVPEQCADRYEVDVRHIEP